jgi:glycosyltransferase involved in cell wall biosynthesis
VNRRIVYIQYTNPTAYPPLEHSAQQLATSGWDVLLLGIRKPDDPPLDWPSRRGITLRQLSPARGRWHRKLHYAVFAFWVLTWVARWRPRWLYASDALSCPVALGLSFWPGVEVVYHEHDAPQLRSRGIPRRLVLWARRKLAERARVRVLPNHHRAEHFTRHVANHRPTFSVWNCPSLSEISRPRDPRDDVALNALYVGSVVPSRLPPSVIEALALLPKIVRLRVIGYATPGHANYVHELQALARNLGVAQRTQFVEGLPHGSMLVESRAADVGLVLMPDDSPQWMPGASNKPFDYLASGLALLVADRPGWRKMFVEPGYGVACDAEDPRSIADALRWLMEHPAETRTMGERGRRCVAAQWNYERQFAPVLERLNESRHRRTRSI